MISCKRVKQEKAVLIHGFGDWQDCVRVGLCEKQNFVVKTFQLCKLK